jgi:hypothetical protein
MIIMAVEPQPQNPDEMSRNLNLRVILDRIEAQSEDKRDAPGKSTIVFSEQARRELENLILRLTNPEKYRQMCEQIELRWAQSWQELARYNPSELRLSLAPSAMHISQVLGCLMYYKGEAKAPSEAPPSLQVLIESPVVRNDFFKAFKISNVSTVLSWYSLLASEEKEGPGNELERVALEVGSSNIAQACGRYLIIPDSVDLADPETFVNLAKSYVAQRTSQPFSESCKLIVHSNELRYQERLATMGFGEWLAHKAFDLIAAPLFLLVAMYAGRSRGTNRGDELYKQFPILMEWNSDMMNPHSPVDVSIQDYIQLDADAV